MSLRIAKQETSPFTDHLGETSFANKKTSYGLDLLPKDVAVLSPASPSPGSVLEG